MQLTLLMDLTIPLLLSLLEFIFDYFPNEMMTAAPYEYFLSNIETDFESYINTINNAKNSF